MNINFTINKYFLATRAIRYSYSSKEDHFWKPWHKLDKQLWKKYDYSLVYQLINPGDYSLYTSLELGNSKAETKYKDVIKQVRYEFDIIFKTKEFKRLEKETELYLKTIEQKWEKQKDDIFEFLEQITGLKIPNLKITVIIVHPKLGCGRSYSKIKTIVWGHHEDWKNYSAVYLAHEILHLVFDYYKIPSDNIGHSLIELISDNELRIYLNQKGKYFIEKEKSVGHDWLRSSEKRILPYWKKYLKQKNRNILQFYKQMKKIQKED